MSKGTGALRKLRVIALGGTLAVLAAGVASAAIPSANGTISACYDKQSGQVRIIDAEDNMPKGCGPKESSVSWNVQGAAGQDGQDGQDGTDGQDGVSGYERVYAQSAMNSSYEKNVWAYCPDGKKIIGGGAAIWGPMVDGGQQLIYGVGLASSMPWNDYGWAARALEFVPTDDEWFVSAYAICANVN